MSVFQGAEAAPEAGGRLGSRGAETILCYRAMAPQHSPGPRAAGTGATSPSPLFISQPGTLGASTDGALSPFVWEITYT